jgi:hypothetical protein
MNRLSDIIVFLLLLAMAPVALVAQDTTRMKVPVQILDGDTLPLVDVKPVVVFPPFQTSNPRQVARYDKLVYNVKKVYPYAKLAGVRLKDYMAILDTIPTEKGRKIFMKKAEDELESQFGDEIRDLTFSQGKILLKLIYRETGSSSFDIVKELRGNFTAFIWQMLARVFGYDLKVTYDPAGDDQTIERIVLMIESGAL